MRHVTLTGASPPANAKAGVAETIVRAVEGCHPDLHGLMYSNVLLTGAPTVQCVYPTFSVRLPA